MPMKIKLLSFDLDDTLWPCMPTIMAAEQALYLWLQQHVPIICTRYDMLQLRQKRLALLRTQPQWQCDLTRLRIESLRELSREFDLPDDWVDSAFDVFYHARQQVTLFDDVTPVLNQLKPHYRLLALTNGNADIQRTGVSHWFEFSLSAREAGVKKSAPGLYTLALEKAGVSAGESVHIGDDPIQDIQGALAAGLYTIWLNREQKVWQPADYRPHAQISSLHQLPELLASIS